MTSRISISLSPCPGHLVRQSSSLLQSYLSRMFGIECVEDEKNRSMIVVGRIGDAHVQTASGGLPRMTSQGHLLRRTNPDTLLLAGGSDAATAWAVYELLERYGDRVPVVAYDGRELAEGQIDARLLRTVLLAAIASD